MREFIFVIAFLTPALAWAESPYAGGQSRPIQALSERQLSDLSAGRGMGLALVAELNGYPGPSHVLANQLGLSSEQRTKVEELFAAMKTKTTSIGNRLIVRRAVSIGSLLTESSALKASDRRPPASRMPRANSAKLTSNIICSLHPSSIRTS